MLRHLFVLVALTAAAPPAHAALTLQERLAARRAVEEVLWSHRTWPAENGDEKPGLEAWLAPDALQRQVEDDLRKSAALAQLWGRPITHDALQAELDRMVRNSQAPGVLREMLEALQGDPALAAEVLARPALADRLARAAFAHDARIHGETYRRALAARSLATDLLALKGAADRVVELRYARGGSVQDPHDLAAIPAQPLDAEEWKTIAEPLRAQPLGILGPLEEQERAFTVTAVTARDTDSVTVSTAVWEKESFDSWWKDHRDGFVMDAPEPIGSYTLGTLAPGNPCTNDTWYPLKRAVPAARMEPVWVWTGSEMIVWGGGSGATGALATGGRYRPDIDVWTEVNAAGAPSARRHATAVWTGTEMIVWGGDDGASPNPVATNTGARYNPALDQWSATPTFNAPSARAYPTSVWTGSVMIVWGGISLPIAYLQTGGIYNPATNSWTATSLVNAPSARYGHTATWLSGEMIVWGGEAGPFLDTGARYNPATDSWASMTSTGRPAGRSFHSAVVLGGRVVLWGGQISGTAMATTGALYAPDFWTALPTTGAPVGRMKHSAVVVNDPAQGNAHMVIFGGQGFDGNGQLYDPGGGGAYRQVQNDWRPMAAAGAPSARHSSAAVNVGTAMVVWGGAAGNTAQGDGRRYDPYAEVWSGISNSGTPGPSPGPRTGHTLVWTGSEAVVWGGAVSTGGSSYSLATDAWTALTEVGSPNHVYWHSAVWTGSVMMVWGGETPGGPVNTGAYWNAGGWVTMDPTNAPSARRRHSAVWAGQSIGMIVWGGDVGSVTIFNDGGTYFYRPLFGDNWVTTPPSPVALGPRVYHTATWTGTRMVIFGGADQTHIWGDGAAFNPLANTWTLLSGVNAPAARYYHTAISPGDDSVIVWGGYNSGNYYGDGARYFVGTNTWTPIAPSGLGGRRMVEATWSGREMLVWGGLGSSVFGDGARYNPGFDAWTPMSAFGAPSARYDHRSRQAGDEMVTWGGSSNTDTGGRYCASCAVLSGFEAAKDLSFSSSTTLAWSANTGVTAYALYRGTFNGSAPLTNHGCFQGGLATPTASDANVPAPGSGFYYLVGASNSCSRTGLGQMTGGAPRANPSCP
ncbi:MAG TPA: kelch repeat-containing protein [Candidatus Polarisedimenticolaceae bacterium]|nr:kelch repeat-containing protein [Candidatus Polarisedimenticolaceae bacterium]